MYIKQNAPPPTPQGRGKMTNVIWGKYEKRKEKNVSTTKEGENTL
jgi:hypothetical protein